MTKEKNVHPLCPKNIIEALTKNPPPLLSYGVLSIVMENGKRIVKEIR